MQPLVSRSTFRQRLIQQRHALAPGRLMCAARVARVASAAAAPRDVAAENASRTAALVAHVAAARGPASRNRGAGDADGAMARQPRARRRGTRSRLRQLPLGRRRARLHEISNSARAGAGLVGRRPPLPDGRLGAAPVRARGVDHRRHRYPGECAAAAAGRSRGAGRTARRGRRRGLRGALRVLGAPRDGPRATDGSARPVACRGPAVEGVRPDAGLVRRRRRDGRGRPRDRGRAARRRRALRRALRPPLRLRPPGRVGRGVLDFARVFRWRTGGGTCEPVAAARGVAAARAGIKL